MNSVNLIGRLTRDPDVRTTASSRPLTVLRLAVPRRGDGGDSAVFVDVVCFDRRAEVAAEYLRSGRRVSVEGRLERRTWVGRSGEPRSRHEGVASHLELLDSPAGPETTDPAGED